MTHSNGNQRPTCIRLVTLLTPLIALGGCPTGTPGGNTVITVNNVTSQININNIRLLGPEDSRPGSNLLSAPLRQGQGVALRVSAPDGEAMPEGVVWTVIASGELNLRVKQDAPDDLRSGLNTNFDSLDTDADSELTFTEVTAGNPGFTQSDFDLLDLNGDNRIARAEVGSRVRIARARFTCVRDGDEYFWNFDGESPPDYCGDTP